MHRALLQVCVELTQHMHSTLELMWLLSRCAPWRHVIPVLIPSAAQLGLLGFGGLRSLPITLVGYRSDIRAVLVTDISVHASTYLLLCLLL
jgi:hypothetical protein